MPRVTIEDGTVSDAYVALLADRGVDYLFANAGTDFAPLIEALAKAQATSGRLPEPITCPHENTAAHMAVGYYLVTGRPQAVMVHVNVGTANMLNGMLNAARGSIPVLFTAGRTPTNEDTLSGHRSLDIHWTQEMFDQSGMVREAVKWDYELRNAEQVETVVDRALNIAMSEPRGPVYLSLPREVLAAPVKDFAYDSPTRHQPAAPHGPNPDAIDRAASVLAAAENPLIITSWAGRNPDAWHSLSAFAERHAIPVVQYRNRYMSIPTDHPMHMGHDPKELLEISDAVLVIDVVAPWLPAVTAPPADATVIHLAVDPMYGYVPVRGHPCDIAIASATHLGLDALSVAMDEKSRADRERIDRRRGRLADRRESLREAAHAVLEKGRSQTPIHPAWITHCINEIKDDDTIIVRESALSQAHIDIDKPRALINAGAASGLGWGLGTALGAKLAARDSLVIDTEGDGAYMFGNPISAHYVAAEQDLPLLTVIFNNGEWNAVRRATRGQTPDGHAARSNRPPLTHLDAISSYEKAVEVADGHGEKVTDPDEMLPALERALKAVTVDKRQAVVNVICST